MELERHGQHLLAHMHGQIVDRANRSAQLTAKPVSNCLDHGKLVGLSSMFAFVISLHGQRDMQLKGFSWTRDAGSVCFCFSGSRFFENRNSEISQLPVESAVWINLVFGNSNYFDPIL